MPETATLTIKLRLRDKHAAELNRQARAVSYVWNYCNEMQQRSARDRRPWLSAAALQRMTAGSSQLLGVSAQTICKTCQTYEKSRRQQRKAWLRFRGRKSLGWVPFHEEAVRVVAPGQIKFRGTVYETMHWRDLPPGAKIRSGGFNQDARGRWYINLPIEVPAMASAAPKSVGIDLGLKDIAALSDGRKIAVPSFYRKSETALATAQRARKSKRARAIHAKVANRRRDFLHKLSRGLADEFGLIVIGDVSPSKLARTSMAKSINDAGWSALKQMLSYKTHLRGGRLLEVPEAYTTQTCSACGAMPERRPRGIAGLGIRRWECEACGASHDRDVNAALNIVRLGHQALAEGALRTSTTVRGRCQPFIVRGGRQT